MRKLASLAMVALVAGIAVPALAEHHESSGDFKIHGEVRVRAEYQDNLTDFTDSGTSGPTSNRDQQDGWPYRFRIGAHGAFSENIHGYVEFQQLGYFGDSTPVRQGGDPTGQFFSSSGREAQIYQAFIHMKEIGDTKMSIRLGRSEHTLGKELHMGNLDFYGGTSFDGARLMWDFEDWDLSAFYYNVLEGQVAFGSAGDEDATFWGAHATFELTDTGQIIEPYILNLNDANGSTGGISGLANLNLWTIGANYRRDVKTADDVEDLLIDWNAEVAIQTGDIDEFAFGACTDPSPSGECDAGGTIFEGWIGFNFNHGNGGRSRIHVGALVASGDDNSADTDADFFIGLFPDNHAHNRLGDADLLAYLPTSFGATPGTGILAGVTDYNIGYGYYSENNTHGIMVSYHTYELTDPAPGTMDDLGDEINIRYHYQMTDNLGFQVGVASFSPGDFWKGGFGPGGTGEDDGQRLWGQARLRW